MSRNSPVSSLIRTLIALSLLMVALGGLDLPAAQAGDAAYKITGRVMNCSSDLSNEPINSSIPPSCTVDVSGATVSTVSSNPQFGIETVTAQTGDDGGFVMLAGYGDTTTMVIGTPLDGMNAGFLSCIYQTPDGTYAGEAVFPLDGSGQAEILYGAQGWYTATCNFFLYSAAPAPVSFFGVVMLCDEDMSANFDPPLGEKCPLVGGGQLTQLTFPNGTNQQQTTDFQGQVTYTGLVTGQNYALIVDRPSFYDGTTAVCAEQANGANLTEEFAIQGTEDGVFSFSIQNSGATLSCSILLYPKNPTTEPDTGGDELDVDGPVSIDVGKYECPTNFSGSTIDEHWNNCELTFNAIGFDIFGNQTGATNFQETGDLAEGVVIFEDLSPDEWQISERKPEGFGEPVVFCSAISQEDESRSDYTQVTVFEGNSIIEVVEDRTDLTCEWFNIPETQSDSSSGDNSNRSGGSGGSDGRGFDVTVRACPPDYDIGADDADPELDCDEALPDVEFTATDSDGESERDSSDSSGEASIDLENAIGDHFVLEQEYPDGIGSSMIWSCERNGQEIDSPFRPLFALNGTNTVHVVIEGGDSLACLWLDLSAEPETTGETGSLVSIAVFECGGIPNPAACDPIGEGFRVVLTDNDDAEQEFTLGTGEDGVATGEVPPGDYAISADLTPCFLDSAAITANGSLLVTLGQTVDAKLFVCS